MLRILAELIMRSRGHAAALIVLCAVLPVPFLSLLGASGLALVTLRLGPKESGFLLFSAALPCAVIAMLGQPALLVTNIGMLYGPVWLLAWVLRRSVSLDWTVQFLGVLGVVSVALVYLVYPEIAQWWLQSFQALVAAMEQQTASPVDGLRELLPQMAKVATGAQAALVLLVAFLCLCTGRAMQAKLFNPDGFRQEFQHLRCHGRYSAALMVCVLCAGLGWPLAIESIVPMAIPLLLAGFGLVHAWAAQRQEPALWLVAFYSVMLLTGLTPVLLLVLVLAVLDSWLNIRARIQL